MIIGIIFISHFKACRLRHGGDGLAGCCIVSMGELNRRMVIQVNEIIQTIAVICLADALEIEN